MEESVLRHDKSNMFKLLESFPEQCSEAVQLSPGKPLPSRYANAENIVVSGMGGSAIAGDVIGGCLCDDLKVPVFVLRDYHTPGFVGKKTLFIAVSYSGNTEETLSAYKEALHRRRRCWH